MNVRLLVDGIVRQTTLLIAQLSTPRRAGAQRSVGTQRSVGARPPPSHHASPSISCGSRLPSRIVIWSSKTARSSQDPAQAPAPGLPRGLPEM